jgi:hypothetical protein
MEASAPPDGGAAVVEVVAGEEVDGAVVVEVEGDVVGELEPLLPDPKELNQSFKASTKASIWDSVLFPLGAPRLVSIPTQPKATARAVTLKNRSCSWRRMVWSEPELVRNIET